MIDTCVKILVAYLNVSPSGINIDGNTQQWNIPITNRQFPNDIRAIPSCEVFWINSSVMGRILIRYIGICPARVQSVCWVKSVDRWSAEQRCFIEWLWLWLRFREFPIFPVIVTIQNKFKFSNIFNLDTVLSVSV